MANRARRLPVARRDLIGIWRFIADDNEAAADRLLARIEQAIVMLREHPFAGRDRSELAMNIRSFPIGNYVLFYRPLADGIELVRVLSSYQDIQPDDVE